ncbi:MAG TPA: GvpL/GvpF family gas vesicle protein, partial [Longimicrobiaceae bacterium]
EESYREEALDARTTDLAWVGERGAAHEAVLLRYADAGPVLPLGLFSLHLGEERVLALLESDGERFRATLERVRGRREWGVRLWRVDAGVAEHLDRLSPRLRELAAEMEGAPPGRRFLLQKKRDAMRRDELRAVGADAAREAFDALRGAAAESRALALPARQGDEGRAMVLNAAFLVDEARFPEFQRAVTEAAGRWGGAGFELEFTGPWPPYHFTGGDGG